MPSDLLASHLSIVSQHRPKESCHLSMQFQYFVNIFTLHNHWKQMSIWTYSSTSPHLKCESVFSLLWSNFLMSYHWIKIKNLNSCHGLKGPAWANVSNSMSCHSPHLPRFIYYPSFSSLPPSLEGSCHRYPHGWFLLVIHKKVFSAHRI